MSRTSSAVFDSSGAFMAGSGGENGYRSQSVVQMCMWVSTIGMVCLLQGLGDGLFQRRRATGCPRCREPGAWHPRLAFPQLSHLHAHCRDSPIIIGAVDGRKGCSEEFTKSLRCSPE